MFGTGIALIALAILAVIVLVGIAVIVSGVIARRRGAGGVALLVAGAVIVLLPVSVIAWTLLPDQG